MKANESLFDGITIFSQVVKEESFSAAAKVTGRSTSYISKVINKLEDRLGVRLLNRTTRSMSLTAEGELYFQQCQQMILDAQQALATIAEGHEDPQGVLKISCPVDFGINYLQPILTKFMNRYPNITLDIAVTNRNIDLVQDGLDIAIRASHQLENSSLICRKIYSCESYFVATPFYLKQQTRPKHPDELKNHRCICYAYKNQPSQWTFKQKDGKELRINVPQTILCNNSRMKVSMLLAHQGICLLPAFCIENELESKKLEILFQNFEPTEINVYAIYPSRKNLAPKVRLFIDFLTHEFEANSSN